MAKERGIELSEVKRDKTGVFDGYIKLTVKTERQTRSVAGTVFSDGKPRFIQIKGINIDAEIGQHMLYTTNTDVPGIIGFWARRSASRRQHRQLPARPRPKAATPSRCSMSTNWSARTCWTRQSLPTTALF
jgi:hypothetical protein